MFDRFETFTTLISSLSKTIRKIKTEAMANYNIKSSHVSCLYYLYKNNSLTAKELCDMCEEDKAAISRTLDFLEKNDFLICQSNQKKRYKSPLCLTEKGNKIGKEIVNKIDNVLSISSSGISENELEILYKSLMIINKNLKNYAYSMEENKYGN